MLLVVTLALVLADAADREWAQFAGTWQRISTLTDGTTTPAARARQFQLVLTRERTYKVHVSGKLITEGTAVLDVAKKPKTVDMTPTTGPGKGVPLLGIYELEGDTYRICYALAGKPRPTQFAAPAGSGHVLIVYQRAKN